MPEPVPVTPVKITETGPVLTKFDSKAIQAIVERTVTAMDKAGVEKFEMDIYANRRAITGAVVYKINNHWSIDAGVAKPYDGPLEFEAHTRVKF